MRLTRTAPPPRRLVALIVAITLVPLVALLSLGWRLLADEQRQVQERLEQSARLVVAALQGAVSSSRQQLAAGAADWPGGAVAVTFRNDSAEARPADRLAYVPTVPALREPPEAVFKIADEREYQKGDYAGSIESIKPLTKAADLAVRAGALHRLGRNLANTGRINEALAAYSELSRYEDVAIGATPGRPGTPASLAGLYLRCTLLERAGRTTELRAEAHALARQLQMPRWLLTESLYGSYLNRAEEWIGGSGLPRRARVFEGAVEALWDQRRTLQPEGQRALQVGADTFTVIWQTTGDTFFALIASSDFVASQWKPPAQKVAAEQNVSFALSSQRSDAADRTAVILRSSQTGLPWDVVTRPDPRVATDPDRHRRNLLIGGFLVMILMTMTASYLIYRAIARELAVARLQSDFVAAVSHEFRTPLTSLHQFTAMLRDNPGLSTERRILCYDVQMRATDRLVGLVESLLDLGRMEAGARRYQFEARDCVDVVRRAVEDFRHDPQAEHFAIELRDEGPVWADADAEALSRAVRNLLENAVKYSPDERRVDVALSRNNGHVRIAVQDHGIGIPTNEQRRVFSKFHRGEQALVRGIKGTGIGLAMVAEIVKAHRGRVELESTVGTGSTFTIVLPARDAARDT